MVKFSGAFYHFQTTSLVDKDVDVNVDSDIN